MTSTRTRPTTLSSEELVLREGGKTSQLGYKGFPAAVCTSRNEVVCHGMPSKTDVLRDGDIAVVTADGRLSAQFEHTVVVTKDGCEVTTRLDAVECSR
jgi:methionine aminopeptidase